MANPPRRLGPWMGIDNVHQADAGVFQLPGKMDDRLPALTAATDVDLDDDGWPASRLSSETLATLTSGIGGFSGAGLLLVQEAGVISKVNLTTGARTALVTGLDATDRVRFHEFGGQVWWCNREYCGRITEAGVSTNWGTAVPPTPTLGTTTGDLPAGIYQVAATYVDGNGIESGAGKAASVTLSGVQDLTATLTVNDAKAVSVRFYVAEIDSKGEGGLVWAKTVAVGALPATITNARASIYPLKTQFMRGPVPGRGIASHYGMLMTWRDEWIYPSSGISTHLFNVTKEALRFPFNVQAVGSVYGGLWVATEGGMFWVPGETLKTMQIVPMDTVPYAAGCKVVANYELSKVQSPGRIALFVNSGGLVAGLPGGQLVPIMRDRITVGDISGKQASITYYERDNLKQILFSLSAAPTEGASYWTVTNPAPTFV